MRSPVKVEIFGQTFTVNSEEQAYMEELAAYVDHHIRQIENSTKTVVPLRVAIMAALDIADEWYKASQREQQIQEETERLCALLLERIEQSEKMKT